MENKSKTALITGGGCGLGKNMSLQLTAKGIDVMLTFHTKQGDALNVMAQIEQTGQKAAALQLNAGDIKASDLSLTSLKMF